MTERAPLEGAAGATARGGLAPRVRAGRLPSGRALIGGLLIALAAGGVFIAHRGATTVPSTRYLVLTEPVPAGATVSEHHLGSLAVDLPDELSAIRADGVDDVLGRVARTPLEPLDLLRPSDLFEPGRFTTAGSVEVAVDLPPARALEGVLQVGSTVDVLATAADAAGTTTVAAGATVVGVQGDAGQEIGSRSTSRVRLSLADAELAEQVVDAAVRSEITLILPAPEERGT